MALSIGNANTVNQTNQTQTTQTVGKDITGSGNLKNTGKTPDTTSQPSYNAILSSLSSMMPQMNGAMVEIFLAEITAKLKDVEENANTDRYKNDQEAKRTSLAEKKTKLDEADKKIQDAQDAMKSGNIFAILKMVFQAIAAALSIVLGALLSPIVPVLGGLMVAAGVVGIIMMVDAAVQQGTGMGIMGNIVKAAGGSPEDVQKADMGFRMGMAAIGLILAVAMIATGRVDSIVEQMANLAGKVEQFRQIASGITSAINIGTAVGDSVQAGINVKVADSQSDAKKLQASAKEMEALLAQLDDFIDIALSRLIGAMNRFNDMLDSITDMMSDKAQSLSNAKFTA